MEQQVVSGKAAVLVVDDNPLIVNLLKGLLPLEDYQVYACNDGEEAMQLLDSRQVDVIVCDVMMPRMGGYELHDQVRSKPELSHIPFIFLTALGDKEDVTRGKEIGADDYVVKPFDPRELLAIIKGKVVRAKNLRNLSEQMYDSYRRRVIHTLSHEFRTPLVAINTGTELLLDNKNLDGERVRNLLEAIQRGGMRLEKLVSDFMVLQQIEAGLATKLFETRAKVLDGSTLLEDCVERVQSTIERAGFSLEVSNLCDDIKVKVYEPHVMDILDRLVSNALKFKRDVQAIEICLVPLDGEIALEVRDRGMGIDLSKIHEAIDVFGQINREKLEQQGGGLGLAIAARYAAVNAGRLEFDNRTGGGCVASLVLPVLKD